MKAFNLLKSKWSILFILAFAFVLCVPAGSSKVFAADSSVTNSVTARTINLTGDGEVTVTPDMAYLYIGVTTDSATAIEAQNANSMAINNVISAIKKEGIKDEDVKTNDYNINPKYEYDKNTGSSKLAGYTVSNTLNITVKDISKVGQILDIAVKNGANISYNISFGISDYEKYYNMALLNALSNAQRKAQIISSFFGVKLGLPVKVVENSSGIPSAYPYPPSYKLDMANSAASTSIQIGTFKVKANVSLVYEY